MSVTVSVVLTDSIWGIDSDRRYQKSAGESGDFFSKGGTSFFQINEPVKTELIWGSPYSSKFKVYSFAGLTSSSGRFERGKVCHRVHPIEVPCPLAFAKLKLILCNLWSGDTIASVRERFEAQALFVTYIQICFGPHEGREPSKKSDATRVLSRYRKLAN